MSNFKYLMNMAPKVFQTILNVSLIYLAGIISFLLIQELVIFSMILFSESANDYKEFLARILILFLYFEFIAMIVKYFKEDYHFPLRYFMYIGITAMVRLIIVDYDNPLDTLLYSLVILVLIIGYFIMNITPLERPEIKGLVKEKKEEN
ncbi:phosphate-starvation-inducible protein PsiE [Aquibacillus rhizosphaerae]|uniref:Protein PsiE n=1 Tax=Aquibacillus rhizosphaerae TaxID=3051431 RepID=A0ABT7L5T2_9BACI|nr:phosphate-starvation-inducible protein PsiE [Aquibacillus sp. LR5S19]MDL4840560.1 phosphate-starvation-inducible protein PsiE [Aquibacillus sp. LR5S19]